EVSSEDARSGRISATDKRYGHQLPIVYPSVRADEVVSVLRPLIVHHAGRVKSKLPLISIVTCTFNTRPRWLAEAAASVLNQTFADWEWCLSDAGSDRTDKRYGHQLPIVYPSVRADEVVSVLRPLIVHHAGRVKSKLPLISIVTCTFNTRPRWLAEAAASVLNQTFADWEWCLSDAG